MENLETELEQNPCLTDEQRREIRKKIDSFVIKTIEDLSPDERKRLYNSIVPKDENYHQSQAEWVSVLMYHLGKNREREGLDCSKETVERLVVEQLLSGEGEAMRHKYRLYRAVLFREDMNTPDSQEASDFLDYVNQEIDKSLKPA